MSQKSEKCPFRAKSQLAEFSDFSHRRTAMAGKKKHRHRSRNRDHADTAEQGAPSEGSNSEGTTHEEIIPAFLVDESCLEIKAGNSRVGVMVLKALGRGSRILSLLDLVPTIEAVRHCLQQLPMFHQSLPLVLTILQMPKEVRAGILSSFAQDETVSLEMTTDLWQIVARHPVIYAHVIPAELKSIAAMVVTNEMICLIEFEEPLTNMFNRPVAGWRLGCMGRIPCALQHPLPGHQARVTMQSLIHPEFDQHTNNLFLWTFLTLECDVQPNDELTMALY
jgi:hypothetical protein